VDPDTGSTLAKYPAGPDRWIDDFSTDSAVSFIHRNRTRPFLLVVG